MATTFKVWIDAPNDASGGNVISPTAFANDSERIAGYVAQTPVPSKKMNTILRETSVVITALMDQFCSSSTVTYISTLANIKTALANGIASKSSVDTVASNLSDLTTTVGNITANNGPIAAVDTRVDNIINGTTTVAKASNADVATNVGNITNDNTGSNATIAFSIGTGANKKSYSKTITVAVPGTVQTAETVTTNIRINNVDKAISSLFEDNGDAKKATTATTATSATSATSATNATNATTATTYLQVHNNSMAINSIFAADGSALSAIHADAADTASNADYATSAGTATSATNANYATSAGTANSADTAYSCTEASIASQAETTDFTHSNWTIKDIGIYDTLTKGGTYEIQVNTSSTYANEWHNFPLITIATGNSGGNHSVCWMTGTAYTEFTYDVSLNSGGVINSPGWQTSTKWRYRRIR